MNLPDALDGAEAVLGRALSPAEQERIGIMVERHAGWDGVLSTLSLSAEHIVALAREARAARNGGDA